MNPGEKGKLKVTATRRGGYKGPIAIEAHKLQANVTSGKATIAADQTTADLDIASAPAATPGDKADVDVVGSDCAPCPSPLSLFDRLDARANPLIFREPHVLQRLEHAILVYCVNLGHDFRLPRFYSLWRAR